MEAQQRFHDVLKAEAGWIRDANNYPNVFQANSDSARAAL